MAEIRCDYCDNLATKTSLFFDGDDNEAFWVIQCDECCHEYEHLYGRSLEQLEIVPETNSEGFRKARSILEARALGLAEQHPDLRRS